MAGRARSTGFFVLAGIGLVATALHAGAGSADSTAAAPSPTDEELAAISDRINRQTNWRKYAVDGSPIETVHCFAPDPSACKKGAHRVRAYGRSDALAPAKRNRQAKSR